MTTPLTAVATSIAPAQPLSATDQARRARVERTAQDFEATFLSSMFQNMFQGTETEAPFGGGQGETAWRSFLTDAMARQVVRTGGIGLAANVAREMIRLQEAASNPAASIPAVSTVQAEVPAP